MKIPTAKELKDAHEETRALPFYADMLQRFGQRGETQHATRGELWALLARLMDQVRVQGEVIKKLAARSSLKYLGVWKEGVHQEGHVVSRGGSMWVCKRATLGKPGECDDWQLAVKHGADGKDGRR